MYDKIPKDLKELNRWVCWRMERRGGKDTKIPINPHTGGNAMSNNPDTWGSFQAALNRMMQDNLNGIGFMLGDGFVGIDLDHCRNPETGAIDNQAKDIILALDSYTEISQSGTGIHIICTGKLPPGKRRKGIIEMYETGRFFVMTGNTLDDGHCDVLERTEELATVHKKYIAREDRQHNFSDLPIEVSMDDNEIIDKAMNAENGQLFTDLMNGNWQDRYQSQSEADMALCNLLAFWTGKDPLKMDRIFRRSGLYREKWDEKRPGGTYGSITIEEAIAGVNETYNPGKIKSKKSKNDKKEVYLDIDTGFSELVESADNITQLPDWIGGPYSDTWNAQRLIDYCGRDIRYNTGKGTWYVWNGQYWEEDRLGQARNKCDEMVTWLYGFQGQVAAKFGADSKKYKDFCSWLARSRNTSKKDNMMKEACFWPGVATLPEDFDQDPWLFNCKNGTINLKTGELLPHKREDLITRMAPVEFDPKAKAPIFEAFLNRIFGGKKHLVDFIQRAIGYSLTGSTQEQAVFVCHGSGANGKSTLIGIIQDIMGEYARNTNFTTFTVRNDSNTNDIARLMGARFVTAMEVGEDKRLNEALIKQLSGGDKISARFLHKEFFDFYPTFKIWMGANHKPNIKETDNGIWRRIKLIPFEVTIPEQERDKDLPCKLREELPGILAWAVCGCLKWQKEGLSPPPEVNMATDEYRSEMDKLQVFLDECTETKERAFVKSSELYMVYEKWCSINGERQMSATKFALKLKERGIKKGRTMVMRIWENIQLSKYGRQLMTGMTGMTGSNDNSKKNMFPWND